MGDFPCEQPTVAIAAEAELAPRLCREQQGYVNVRHVFDDKLGACVTIAYSIDQIHGLIMIEQSGELYLGRRTRACCTRRGKKEWRSFAILYFCHEFIMAADIRPDSASLRIVDVCAKADWGRRRRQVQTAPLPRLVVPRSFHQPLPAMVST
jgi:hypothetical protein